MAEALGRPDSWPAAEADPLWKPVTWQDIEIRVRQLGCSTRDQWQENGARDWKQGARAEAWCLWQKDLRWAAEPPGHLTGGGQGSWGWSARQPRWGRAGQLASLGTASRLVAEKLGLKLGLRAGNLGQRSWGVWEICDKCRYRTSQPGLWGHFLCANDKAATFWWSY